MHKYLHDQASEPPILIDSNGRERERELKKFTATRQVIGSVNTHFISLAQFYN